MINYSSFVLFRGEKLYVTKAEGWSGRWKKILCWVLALLLLAGAIAVAVLIGGICILSCV